MKQYFDIIVKPEADKLTVLLERPRRIKVTYIDTSIQCESTKPMDQCKNPDCSWFNHSQTYLR